MGLRRIVTGHDAGGRSVVILDDTPPAKVLEKAGGLVLTELWETQEAPAALSGGDRRRTERKIEPERNGTVFRVIEYPPDSQRLRNIQPEAHFQSMGAQAVKGRHPGMHRTKTLDYAIVLKGEIYAVLDEGEALLKAGDVLVQQGTSHAWSNRSDEPCLIAFVLIDATAA